MKLPEEEEEHGGYTSPLMSPHFAASTSSSEPPSEEKKGLEVAEGPPVISTVDELLRATTAWRPYPLFIIFTMSFLWSLCALSAISPAFTAPAADDCTSNCSFYTIQHEFNLTTSFLLLEPAELTTSIYFLGNLLIGQLFAVLADRFGRRPIIIISLLLTGIGGSLGALAPNFPLLLVARFIQGSCYTPLTTVNYVLSGESIPHRSQSLTSIFFGVSWVCGYCFLAPLSVWFPTWRSLQFATSIPNVVVALFLMLTLPESLGYSVDKNDRKSVEKWIKKNEVFSRRKLNYNIAAIMENEKKGEERLSIFQMFREILASRSITRRMVVETFLWIFTFMTYCALSLTSTSVGNSDPLISFVFSGVVELPAYLFIPICLKWTKRRPTRFLCHFVGSIALLTMYFLSADTSLHLIIWLTAKFCAACCYIFCFIYAAELFPTFCRSCCIGVCSTCCNIGAIVAPHIFAIDASAPGAQFLVLSAIGVVCSVLTWFQQETKV
uniref:MFS domain-containing protein n=1 Tax=Caenorhabditis tropicalis TaxID=1561998 RepID=A0A1I7UJX8_9PELO